MSTGSTACLQDCLARYRERIPDLAGIAAQLETASPASRVAAYEQSYPLLERAMWSGDFDFESLLACYQALFREQDALIRHNADVEGIADTRHHFILSIPVADRPPHLRACLDSVYQLCRCFAYGGKASGVYDRIRIIVAEDSREEENIRQHIDIINEYRHKGLQVSHFDQDEQYALLQAIPEAERDALGRLLTTRPRERFYLKGQAANRNLSYLKCAQMAEDRDRTLYYFVDSDEAFCVNRPTAAGTEAVYALNYFHYIDKAFRTGDSLLLTGKMVGDPPVSPSVMAANFLDDVTAFFGELADIEADADCRFHGPPPVAAQSSGAIYHDLAALFGFDNRQAAFPYRCRLAGRHDHTACLDDFAQRLAAFFFGEHLFRKTLFDYANGFDELTPARTIYPGNYVVNHAGLKYVIPFGHLRLRMSGPTAGRLIAAEIGSRFAAINMPHLHRRTTEAGLGSEFRPGVALEDETAEQIDLSNEFERQFFGDLMLFTTETLLREADVDRPFDMNQVVRVMQHTEQKLLAEYQQKHDAVLEKSRALEALVFDGGHWWLDSPDLGAARRQVRAFIDNIRRNFGEQSPAWQQIQSVAHRAGRKQQILDALMHYRSERNAWDRLFHEGA